MPKVLIQAGHVAPREPGFESGTGTVREQELTARMQGALAAKFQADGRFTVTLAPGDLPDGWTGDVALFLHGDGAGNPSAHGFSFGWPDGDPGRAPALATLITSGFLGLGHPGGHHPDNYTGGLRGYYGYRRTTAPTRLLIEHGFMTNPGEQAWVFQHLGELANATYRAVVAHLGLAMIWTGRPSWADGLQLWVTPPNGDRRIWVGWEQAWPAVEWVARHGLKPGAKAAIAWLTGPQRRVERDPAVVAAVCRSLVARYRKGTLR